MSENSYLVFQNVDDRDLLLFAKDTDIFKEYVDHGPFQYSDFTLVDVVYDIPPGSSKIWNGLYCSHNQFI